MKLPLSQQVSRMFKIQDSVLKASAKELLRTDFLHASSKQLHNHTENQIGSYALAHYRSEVPPLRLHTSW